MKKNQIDGNRVRILRKNKGLTQSELASIIGVSTQVISNLETGKIEGLRDRTLKRLCYTFHTVEDYLFGLSDEVNKHANGLKQPIFINPDKIDENLLNQVINNNPESIQLICDCNKFLDSNTMNIVNDVLKAFINNKK